MNKKTVRTGIVGAGFSASFHYEALCKVYGTNVEVVGVHTLDREVGKAYAEKRGIRLSPPCNQRIFGSLSIYR